MNILISPYPALCDWLGTQGHNIDCVTHELDISMYSKADVIYGQLDVESSRLLAEKKITYMHISANIDKNKNVDELTKDYFNSIGTKVIKHRSIQGEFNWQSKSQPLVKDCKQKAKSFWHKRTTSPWTIWFLTTFSLLSFAWLGDLLAGSRLFAWLPGSPPSNEPILLWPTLISLAIYVTCSFSLIKLGRSFLPTLRRVNVTKNAKPKKVLLLNLSQIKGLVVKDGRASVTVGDPRDCQPDILHLTGDLAKDIQTLTEKEKLKKRWNGTQQLRALSKHIKKVEHIGILSTDDIRSERHNMGSKHQSSLFKAFLHTYVKHKPCQISLVETYLDPNDVGQTYNALVDILNYYIDDLGYDDSDICLDITGGTSAMSAAAALATIHRNTQFQYVSTVGMNEVFQQDLQLALSAAKNR